MRLIGLGLSFIVKGGYRLIINMLLQNIKFIKTVIILSFWLVILTSISQGFILFAKDINNDGDPQMVARHRFKEGLKFYDKHRYAEALDNFQQAYAYKSSYKILYNIGQVQAQLRRPHKALAAMENYLADGGDDISQKRRAEVLDEIERLKLQVGNVFVKGQNGSEAWIDGENRGVLPLSGVITLKEGTHRLVVRFGDQTPCEKVFKLAGGSDRTVSCLIEIDDKPSENAMKEATSSWQMNAVMKTSTGDPEQSGESKGHVFWRKGAPWVATGIAVILAGIATGSAVKARSLNSKLNESCQEGVCSPDYQDDIDSLSSLAKATDALFVTAGVFAVGATILFIAPWDKSKSGRGDRKKISFGFYSGKNYGSVKCSGSSSRRGL